MDAALVTACLVTFVAEFGDKTQLAVIAMASRGRKWRVLMGAAAAYVLLTAIAAALGAFVGARVPQALVWVIGGVVFLAIGLWSLRGSDDEPRPVGHWGAFGVILVAEFGDKTQVAVASLAAQTGKPWQVTIGASLGLVANALLAVLVGGWLADRARPEVLRRVAAWVFLAIGAASLLWAVWLVV